MGEHETVATDGDIRARLLLSLNSKDACGLCIIRPQEVQEAADEIESLRASNQIMFEASSKKDDEIERLRAENERLANALGRENQKRLRAEQRAAIADTDW